MTADLTSTDYWATSVLRSAGRLLMLAALSEQPRHGYDIRRRISALCGDWCCPSDAMIYPAIKELETAGLIRCREETEAGRRRRVCELTSSGRQALEVGASVWAQYLPALGAVVAASQQRRPGAVDIEPDCCPTCCGGDSRAQRVPLVDPAPADLPH